MSSNNHFHLTLPSNASMDIFSYNTAAQYVTKLPKWVELDGDWSVALKEISTPLAFDNILSEFCKFQVKNNDQHLELALQDGLYKVNEAVINEVNKLANPFNIDCHLSGRRNQKVTVTVGDTHVFRPNDPLSFVMGVRMECNYPKGKRIAERSMTLPPSQQISTLYVYCNILENAIIGDVTAPLLRVVEVKVHAKKYRMHTIMHTPLFVPVQKKSFDTVEIWIMTNMGVPAPFSSGKSHLVLELKKSGLLNNLI